MDKGQYLALLENCDKSDCSESSSQFDRQTEVSRLHRFAAELQVALHTSFEVEADDRIQDATFYGQLVLPPGVLVASLPVGESVVLRVSNFCRFAAINSDERVKPQILERITQLLGDNGYVFIPYSVLARPYTGVAGWLSDEATWWDRYFDWV